MSKLFISIFLCALLCAFDATSAIPNSPLSGQVLQQNGQPLAEAQLRVIELNLNLSSDSNGLFRFQGEPQTQYKISVSQGGNLLEVLSARFSLEQVNVLHLSQQELERVVVTAGIHGRSALKMAAPALVLSGDVLLSKQGGNLGETLAQQPGVSLSSFGSGAGRPVIRGLSGSRVKALQNGLDSLDAASTSPDHSISAEPILAKQIEVLKGPATLLYGSGAIGGVVNVVDYRIPETLVEDGLQGAAELRYNGSANGFAGVARLDGSANNIAWHLDAYQRDADNLKLPTSLGNELNNSQLEADGKTIGGSWIDDWGFLGMAVGRYNNNYGLPAEDDADELVRLDVKQERIDIKGLLLKPISGIEQIKFKSAINDYRHVELEGDEIGTVFSNQAHETRIEIVHSDYHGFIGAYGLQLSYRDFSAIGEEAFVPPSKTTSTGVFLLEEKAFGPISVELGTRFERQSISSEELENNMVHRALSASIGGIWNVGPSYLLSAVYTHAQRPPNAEELLSDGPHLATQSYERGDQNLQKERANNIDISLRKHLGELSFSLSLFRNQFQGFIYEEATGEVEDELPVYKYVQDAAVFSGAEIEADWLLIESAQSSITLHGQADYVRAIRDDGHYLPRISPSRVGLGLLYERTDWYLDIQALRYQKQNKTAELESATPGYTMLNIDFNYHFFMENTELSLFAKVSNVLDEEVFNHTSFIKELAPQAGRAISMGARIEF